VIKYADAASIRAYARQHDRPIFLRILKMSVSVGSQGQSRILKVIEHNNSNSLLIQNDVAVKSYNVQITDVT